MAKCPSQPGPTRVSASAITPALAITMFNATLVASWRSENLLMLSMSPRSTSSIETRGIFCSAVRAASGRRLGTMTDAPAAASARVVSKPIPE
jgi:hypothetical protein